MSFYGFGFLLRSVYGLGASNGRVQSQVGHELADGTVGMGRSLDGTELDYNAGELLELELVAGRIIGAEFFFFSCFKKECEAKQVCYHT